jgi:tetratricopeptide (TPR) repeat protein
MMDKTMRVRTGAAILFLGLMVLTFWSSGCRKRGGEDETVPPPREEGRTEAEEAVQEKAPRLGLMLNQLSEIETYPGWPVLVELAVRHPRLYRREAGEEPLTVASRGASWAAAVTLSVKTSAGRAMTWPLKSMPSKDGPLTLDAERIETLRWWLAGEDTAAITEGDYRIVATLDTRGVKKTGVWQGRVASEPAVLHFHTEPSPLTEEQAEEKLLLLAAFAQDAGESAKAKEYIDTLLGAQPESLQGLSFKADQLEETGDKEEAMRLYEQAIRIFNRKYPDAEPPRMLYKNYNRLLSEVLKKEDLR